MSNIKFNEFIRDKLNKYNKLEYGIVSTKRISRDGWKTSKKVYEYKRIKSESDKI